MTVRFQLMAGVFGVLLLAASTALAGGNGGSDDGGFCMDVVIDPFHMVPGFTTDEGACAVPDYWDGELQETFYPFTLEDHLFNCEVSGNVMPLSCAPDAPMVPTSVQSEGKITGTIGGHAFEATLFCASLTNYYEKFCVDVDPCDPDAMCFQLAQPFLKQGLPFPRVTEVSVFDGAISVGEGKKAIPLVMATRAAGITHLEDPPQLVGASVTHSLLGMATYEIDDGEEVEDAEVLEGSADLLLQGHIFAPVAVEEDEGAAVVRGTICSKDLSRLLKRKGRKGGHEEDDD